MFFLFMANVVIYQGCSRFYFPATAFRRSPPVLVPKQKDNDYHQNINICYSNNDFLTNSNEYNFSGSLGYALYKYWKFFGLDFQSEMIIGTYWVSGIEGYDGSKRYFGAHNSLFLGLRFGNDKIGFAFGPQTAFTYEFGPYSDFRKKAKQAGLIETDCEDYCFHYHGILNFQFYTKDNVCVFFQGKIGIMEIATLSIGTTIMKNSLWISMMPPIDWPGFTLNFGYSREF